jgi:hypothetical protein
MARVHLLSAQVLYKKTLDAVTLRYAQKLWIEDCFKNVVYLLPSDLEEEEAHRCEGFTTTMKPASSTCSTLTRSLARERVERVMNPR